MKAKSIKKLTANDSKSYLGSLNKLVDQYNIDKENADYFALSEEIESSHKTPKFKVGDESELLSTRLHRKLVERKICY